MTDIEKNREALLLALKNYFISLGMGTAEEMNTIYEDSLITIIQQLEKETVSTLKVIKVLQELQ